VLQQALVEAAHQPAVHPAIQQYALKRRADRHISECGATATTRAWKQVSTRTSVSGARLSELDARDEHPFRADICYSVWVARATVCMKVKAKKPRGSMRTPLKGSFPDATARHAASLLVTVTLAARATAVRTTPLSIIIDHFGFRRSRCPNPEPTVSASSLLASSNDFRQV
jgi:hypothetical protein